MKIVAQGLSDEGADESVVPGPEEIAAERLADLVSPEAVDRMLADAEQAGMALDGPGGLLNQLTRTVLERALGAELDDHRKGVTRARTTRTTVPDPGHSRAPDLVERDFTASAPGELLVADFTHVPLDGGGFGYAAFCVDAYAGLIAGWECSLSKETPLGGEGDPAGRCQAGAGRAPGRRGSHSPLRCRVAGGTQPGSARPSCSPGSQPDAPRSVVTLLLGDSGACLSSARGLAAPCVAMKNLDPVRNRRRGLSVELSWSGVQAGWPLWARHLRSAGCRCWPGVASRELRGRRACRPAERSCPPR